MSMNIDEITIGQLRQLQAMSAPLAPPASDPDIGRVVGVRCRDAGVWLGELTSRRGREVVLRNAHRIWRWRGARTLSELFSAGCDSATKSGHTRVACQVALVVLLEACEIHVATTAAIAAITTAGWAP